MVEPVRDITIYGTLWCPDCKRAKQFLGDRRIPYRFVDIERDPRAMGYVEEVTEGRRRIPVVIFPDGTILVEPSNAELAAELGLPATAERSSYDVVIVGGGPAGLTAAIYAAREKLETAVLEKGSAGGQAGTTQRIDNCPGFDEGISGEELARRLTTQARRFGVQLIEGAKVVDLGMEGQYREAVVSDGTSYYGQALLLAPGSSYRKLGVPGEDELIGVNVHYCATCDGAFYRDKEVLVIGGGNSGFQEGLYLTKFAARVTIVEFAPQAKASSILQERIAERDDMEVVTNHAVQEFLVADGRLAGVRAMDQSSGEERIWRPDGVFVFIGMRPNTDFLPPQIELDRYGFIVTDPTLQTSARGIFAAGDARAGATAQIASAAGEGATAALMIRQYLQGR